MSTPRLRLISHKLCPYVQRARIVLHEKAILHDIEFINLNNKPAWFLQLSPLGKVPVLLVDDAPIFESAVIAEYLDEITADALHPADPLSRAENRSWIEFASSTLAAIGAFYSAPDAPSFQQSVKVLRTRMTTLESAISEGPYFNGVKFSLVDAAFGPVFRYFDVIDLYADFELFSGTPKVSRYRDHLGGRESVQQAVVGDYSQRLHQFFLERNSYLTSLIPTSSMTSKPALA